MRCQVEMLGKKIVEIKIQFICWHRWRVKEQAELGLKISYNGKENRFVSGGKKVRYEG